MVLHLPFGASAGLGVIGHSRIRSAGQKDGEDFAGAHHIPKKNIRYKNIKAKQ